MPRIYRLKELIEELQKMQEAPVHPEAIKTGMMTVFVYVRDAQNPTKIRAVRGEIELRDMGAYIELGISV